MPSEPSPNGQLALEYLRRFPSFSSKRLASILFTAAPGAFTNEEVCRSMIRYYRGSNGNSSRMGLRPEHFVPKVNIVESDAKDWLPLELTSKDFPLIAGGDAHVPYHDQDILEMFIERAIEMKARTVLLMGDWWDCYQLSKFLTDPRKRHTSDEVKILKGVLKAIRDALPEAMLTFRITTRTSLRCSLNEPWR